MSPAPSSVRRALALLVACDLALAPVLARRFAAPIDHDALVELARGGTGILLAAAGVVCAVLFGRARGHALFLIGALGIGAVLQEGVGHALGSYFEPAHVTGMVAVGWLAGEGFAWLTRTDRDACGVHGALAGIAAVYVCAGLAKLIASGFAWGVDPVVVRAMIAAHHHVDAGPLRDAVVSAVLRVPALGVATALGTLVIELGSVLLLVSRVRRVWSALLLLFHAVLFALTGILFVEGAVLLLVLAGFGEPLARRVRGRRIASLYGIACAVVALAWGATRPRLGDVGAPAILGLLGAWLAIEALSASEEAPTTNAPASIDRRRAQLAAALWLGLASLVWLWPGAPRTHPRERAERASDR